MGQEIHKVIDVKTTDLAHQVMNQPIYLQHEKQDGLEALIRMVHEHQIQSVSGTFFRIDKMNIDTSKMLIRPVVARLLSVSKGKHGLFSKIQIVAAEDGDTFYEHEAMDAVKKSQEIPVEGEAV